MMDAEISELFNADFQDNSFEELAKQLLIMHEECLQSNYSSIEKLRNSHVQGNAVFQSRQVCTIGCTFLPVCKMGTLSIISFLIRAGPPL